MEDKREMEDKVSGRSQDLGVTVAVVRTYVEGMVWGDADRLRTAFHPKACCIGHYDGVLEWDTLDAFVQSVTGETAAPGITPYWQINGIDIVGDTAVVRVENDWAGQRFDDTLTLLQNDDGWQIVTKVFHQRGS
jgi:hypothetical protein